MNPIAIMYPLDLTGINPNNLVVNEPQTLLNNPNRAFVPNYGPFYSQGLIIVDQATGQPLTKTSQYVCAQLHQDLSVETGLEVMQVIVVTDPSVSNNLLVTYQVVGGEYAYSTDALLQMLAAVQIDNRSVAWGQILGRPSQFPPTQHLHDIGDTYGWEYVVDALEQLRQSILTGDDAARENMRNYIDAAVTAMNTTVSGFNALLSAHAGNLNNPHQVTATEIGLGNLKDYAIATPAEVAATSSNTLYVTPFGLSGLSSALNTSINSHVTNQNNPHAVTAAQVGLGNVINCGWASLTDAQQGDATLGYMNPALTKAAVMALAYTPLNTSLSSHVADQTNPHKVNAAQVGLGLVPNAGYASLTEAKAGTGNNLMSAYLTGQAINSIAVNPLNTHIANKANPHGVTAAQVGSYTIAQVDSTVANLQSQIAARQASLGFTPVQQGGGAGMATNKIYIGWDGNTLNAQVDATAKGPLCFAGNSGYVTDATYHQSFGAVGYVKFPNGFILNWGSYTPTTRWAEGSVGVLTFALAFPNACLGVSQSTANYNPNNTNATYYDETARVYNLTVANFTFYINGFNTNGDNWPGMYWMAWGY